MFLKIKTVEEVMSKHFNGSYVVKNSVGKAVWTKESVIDYIKENFVKKGLIDGRNIICYIYENTDKTLLIEDKSDKSILLYNGPNNKGVEEYDASCVVYTSGVNNIICHFVPKYAIYCAYIENDLGQTMEKVVTSYQRTKIKGGEMLFQELSGDISIIKVTETV